MSPVFPAIQAELVLSLLIPLSTTVMVVGILRRGSDRGLVLPTPMLFWLICRLEGTLAPLLLAHGGMLVTLWACWQQRRGVAQWAAITSGAAAAWLVVDSLP